jgi:hypothetical protein
VKSGNRAAVPSKPRVETKGIWRRIELCLNFIHAIVPVWGYSHPARLRECRNPGTGPRQIILEMRRGTAQGWRRKAEQMALAHNRIPRPRSRRHEHWGAAPEPVGWKPYSAAAVRSSEASSNRRDAMDAEEDGSQSPEGASMRGAPFECPLPFISLCTAIVEIARSLRRNSAASHFPSCPFPSIRICFGFRASGFGFPAPPGCAHRVSTVCSSWPRSSGHD